MPTHTSASLGASSGPPSGRMMPPPPCQPFPDELLLDDVLSDDVPVDVPIVSPPPLHAAAVTVNDMNMGSAQRRCTVISDLQARAARTNAHATRG